MTWCSVLQTRKNIQPDILHFEDARGLRPELLKLRLEREGTQTHTHREKKNENEKKNNNKKRKKFAMLN